GGTEFYGRCPIHRPKANTTSFSYDLSGRYHCFSCGARGRGAIDLVMALKKIGFAEATKLLSTNFGGIIYQHGARPQLRQLQQLADATENQPFKASYEKYFKDDD